MRSRASRISLIVFVIMLVLSGFDLSVAGNEWPLSAIAAVFAAIPVMIGPSSYRFWGLIGLVLSAILIAGDLEAGKILQKRMREHRESIGPARHLTNGL